MAAAMSGVIPVSLVDSIEVPVSSIRQTVFQSCFRAAPTSAVSLGEAGTVSSKSEVKQRSIIALRVGSVTGSEA